MLRTDFIFSIWIFVWFVFYVFKLTTYNPTFALLIAVGFILISIVYFVSNNIDNYHIYRFVIICIIEKFLPLSYLYYIEDLNIETDDIVFTGIIFLAYNVNLLLNDTDLYQVYKKYTNSYLDTEAGNNMFYTHAYDDVYKYFYDNNY
jgi:hypothetical protein